MSILKVEGERFEIQRDTKANNAFVWSGLTVGKLMALRRGLQGEGLSRELFVCLDNAIALATAEEDAELAKAQAQRMTPKGV